MTEYLVRKFYDEDMITTFFVKLNDQSLSICVFNLCHIILYFYLL